MSCENVKDLMDDRCEEPQNLHLEVEKMAGENFFSNVSEDRRENVCFSEIKDIFSMWSKAQGKRLKREVSYIHFFDTIRQEHYINSLLFI